MDWRDGGERWQDDWRERGERQEEWRERGERQEEWRERGERWGENRVSTSECQCEFSDCTLCFVLCNKVGGP